MSSGVNSGFAKCFILFIVTIVLLQGCVYLGLSIWGLTLRSCSNETTDITESPFQFAMEIIYFMRETCGNPSVTISAESESIGASVELPVQWEKSFSITNRMFIFLITYAVISALWIITSLLVLSTICGSVTKTTVAICYWPWFLFVIAGSIVDTVATGYFVHDILNTMSAEDVSAYVGLTIPERLRPYLSNYEVYFMTPAIVMTCIASRVVLIWLLNIFGSIFCLSLSKALVKREDKHEDTCSIPARSEPTSKTEAISSPAMVQQQQIQSPWSHCGEQLPPQQIKPRPLSIQIVPTPEVSRQYSVQDSQSPPLVVYPPSAPTPDAGVTTYRPTETHPNLLNYPQTSQEVRQISPQILSESTLNSRYSGPENFTTPIQSQRVSAELRSQLPWSYTNMLVKPQAPRKPQVQIYPDIPEADYGITENVNTQQPQQALSRW